MVDIMLIGLGRRDVATTTDLLVRNVYVRGWYVNRTKIQGLSISVKLLGMRLYEACQGER